MYRPRDRARPPSPLVRRVRVPSEGSAGSLLRALALAAILPLLLSACQGDSAEGSAAIVEDSAGVQIISSPSSGAWDAGQEWSVVEELRIGVSSGDPELQFGNIIGLDVDEEGRIVTLDGQARRVRVFDADGALVHAFGRSGGGPGELSQPGALFVDSEMRIVIPDLGNQRITRFSLDGDVLDSPTLELTEGVPLLWVRAHDRGLYQQFRRMDMTGGFPQGDMVDEIIRLGPGASPGEPVLTLPPGETFSAAADGTPQIHLFSPEPVWTVLEDGRLVSGLSHEYSLSIRSPSGEVESIVRRDVRRHPVTAGAEESIRDVWREAWSEAGLPAETTEQLLGAISFEEEWPALAALLPGPDGTLWVQRVDPDDIGELTAGALESGDFGSPTWDVIDPDGTFLGTVEMPSSFSPTRFVGDRLYGVHRDDLDVQQVMRMRLVRGGA